MINTNGRNRKQANAPAAREARPIFFFFFFSVSPPPPDFGKFKNLAILGGNRIGNPLRSLENHGNPWENRENPW